MKLKIGDRVRVKFPGVGIQPDVTGKIIHNPGNDLLVVALDRDLGFGWAALALSDAKSFLPKEDWTKKCWAYSPGDLERIEPVQMELFEREENK